MEKRKEEVEMAKCYVCGKTTSFGRQVSKSHRVTRTKRKANLQRIKIKVNGGVKRVYVCTKCLKAGKVEKVV